MKYRHLISAFFILLAGWFCTGPQVGYAQDNLGDDPGYVDFSTIEKHFFTEPDVQVNIKGQLLKLVAEASREDDPEFADLLLELRAIQVRKFAMQPEQIRTMELHSEQIGEDLEDRGWDTVVRLRDYGQYVDVYAIENPETIQGLMMMVVDSENNETVLINIVGDIEADELGRIGNKFDIAPLTDVMENL